MSLSPTQQLQELFKKTATPLILLPSYPTRDMVASALGLGLFLESAGKEVTLAGDHILLDKEALSFLKEPKNLVSSITGARDFVLSFNTEHNKIVDVRTETLPDELRIYLTPERGAIDPRDFSFIPARFKFDLAIVIGSPDKESLGKVYEENPDIFYEVPIINIDNHPNNELFGQVNFVEITASSTAEMLTEILEKTDASLLRESVAEALLTGIISETESFQKKNTTPKALHTASLLMDRGADQQKIVRSLYKTQPLHLLKLWGRVMAGVRYNEELRLIWALVNIEDLVQSRAKTEDLPLVLEKIKSNYSSASTFLILYPETGTHIQGIMKAASSENLLALKQVLVGSKLFGDTLRFSLDAHSLDEAEQKVIAALRASSPTPFSAPAN